MKAIDKVSDTVAYISAAILVLLSALIIFDALSRYLFHTGSIALQELEWHLFDVVILMGISYALKENAHVRVDIFYAHFSSKTKALIAVCSQLFLILPFSVLIIVVGYDFVLQSFIQMEGSADPGGLPYRFVVKSLMLLSFIMVIVQSLSELIKAVKVWRS